MSDPLALILIGVAAAAAIVLVATPLLRAGSREERLDAIGEGQRHRLALREERDDALAALRELEFDHRTGKIADVDYRPLVAQYRRRVASALEALDAAAAAGRATVAEAAGVEAPGEDAPGVDARGVNGEAPAADPEPEPAPDATSDGTTR